MPSPIRLLAPALLLGATEAPRSIDYTVSPVLEGGALASVAVEVRLRADPSGVTTLELPDSYGGEKEHWRFLSPITAESAIVSAPAPARRVLRSAPNAPLVIRYRIRGAYPADPDAAGGNAYKGAVIRPTWFAGLGEFLFVTPKGSEEMPARLAWTGWPASWTAVSSVDDRPATVSDVAESSLLAGPDLQVRTRPIRGGTLRLASRGRFGWNGDVFADQVAGVVGAQRAFWGEADGDYTVSLFGLAPTPGLTSMGGTGRARGFVLYASPDSTADALHRLLAHEYAHNWIPRRLGAAVEGQSAPLFWLSEGFTDFYTARTLLRAGLWTPRQFADDLNRTLATMAGSPAARYPNARIAADFWSDPDVGQLPYDRGHLFAHRLDAELRKRGGPGLDAVMFAMRDRWVAAPVKPPLLANLLAVLDARGFDARPLIARHIDAGAPIDLPADLLGRCAIVARTSIPVFDPGFDREASARAGAFAGVDPNGPAYAAGLRAGMKRLARLGGQEGDSRVPLRYRVGDGSHERVLSWLPAGRKRLPVQEIRLTDAASDGCRLSMSSLR